MKEKPPRPSRIRYVLPGQDPNVSCMVGCVTGYLLDGSLLVGKHEDSPVIVKPSQVIEVLEWHVIGTNEEAH